MNGARAVRLNRSIPCLVFAAAVAFATHAENIVFPPDAGVIDLVAQYGVKGDGETDNTQAFRNAFAENASGLFYLANGVYIISDRIDWGGDQRYITLQGQSRDATVIQLADRCSGYTDASSPKAMIWTGTKPAQRFGNYVRNLTLNTGSGNPGAIGAQFISNNIGSFRDVTIRSEDGRGAVGLDMAYTDEEGPCLIKNVLVDGFDYGIKTKHAVDGIFFEHIEVRNQNIAGFVNEHQCLSIRGLISDNSVPAFINKWGQGVVTLIDSELRGGSTDSAAVSNKAVLFVRNLRTDGYGRAIENGAGDAPDATGPEVTEWVSHGVRTLFDHTQQLSLNLPVKETPQVPWDEDFGDWANVQDYGAVPGGGDDTKALQDAIDAGKTTVYLPRGRYHITGTVLIRGNVRRIIGIGASFDVPQQSVPALKLVDGTHSVVVIERINHAGYQAHPTYDNGSSRTLVVQHCAGNGKITGSGDVFLEDIVGNIRGQWIFGQQNTWARQLNVETREGVTHVINDGGKVWILGYKTENWGTMLETRGGGFTEVLGGFIYTITRDDHSEPMFINHESNMSVTIGESNFVSPSTAFENLVRETQDGTTRTLTQADVPRRGAASAIPLYVGTRPDLSTPASRLTVTGSAVRWRYTLLPSGIRFEPPSSFTGRRAAPRLLTPAGSSIRLTVQDNADGSVVVCHGGLSAGSYLLVLPDGSAQTFNTLRPVWRNGRED